MIMHLLNKDHVRVFNDGSTAYLGAGYNERGIAIRINTPNTGYSSATITDCMRLTTTN
jgi:hypothetical protein